MERIPLKRHYQITLVNELTRIATFFMGIGRLRIFRDRRCMCTSVGESPAQNARKEILRYCWKHRSNKKGLSQEPAFSFMMKSSSNSNLISQATHAVGHHTTHPQFAPTFPSDHPGDLYCEFIHHCSGQWTGSPYRSLS